jgi:hypothetical protein
VATRSSSVLASFPSFFLPPYFTFIKGQAQRRRVEIAKEPIHQCQFFIPVLQIFLGKGMKNKKE